MSDETPDPHHDGRRAGRSRADRSHGLRNLRGDRPGQGRAARGRHLGHRSAPAPSPFRAVPGRDAPGAPAQGEVRVEEGPFTDRIRLTRLTLTGGSAVSGHLAITSDVSDVLALELSAAYYDSRGRFIGTGSFQYQEEGQDAEGGHHHDGPRAAGEGIDFKAPATKLTGTAAAAVVSVPVLVNE